MAELELVFFKLSAIDLCQARCVCRKWQRAIDDPNFRKSYACSHDCIPHLCLCIADDEEKSIFLRPVENSPRSEWRLFQTLPKGMRIVSSDVGLLCLATFEKFGQTSSIFVWHYSDLNSSPARVPLPPEDSEQMHIVVYNRERDRSTHEFCVAIFVMPWVSLYIYDSARGEWSRRKQECPEPWHTFRMNGFYPVLDHGEVVVFCTGSQKIARYNLWDGCWRILEVDPKEMGANNLCFLQLDRDRLLVVSDVVIGGRGGKRRGEKWEIVLCHDKEFDVNSTCTDGRNSIWLVDWASSRIVHFGVDSKSWSVVEAPDALTESWGELAWFSC